MHLPFLNTGVFSRITSSIITKLLVSLILIFFLSLLPLYLFSNHALSSFGDSAKKINEQQIKKQAYSYLTMLTAEQTYKYENLFEKISTVSSLLATQARSIYSGLEIPAKDLSSVDRFRLSSKNGIFYTPKSEPIVSLYWGGPNLTPAIKAELIAMADLYDFLIVAKDKVPESFATHIIAASGVGCYYTLNEEAKKAAFNIPPTSIFDLRDGEPVTIFTQNVSKKVETRWTSIYKDDAIKGLSITASSPIYDNNGQFMGITGIDVSLEYIINEILSPKNIDENGIEKSIMFSFLLDQNGRLIAFPEKFYDLFGLDIDISSFKHSSDVLNHSLANSSKPAIKKLDKEILSTSVDDLLKFVLNENKYVVSIGKLGSLGWYLGNVVREVDMLNSIQDTQNTLNTTQKNLLDKFFIIVCMSLILALLLLFWSVQLIIAPLKELTQSTMKVTKGDWTKFDQEDRGDEVGGLAVAFNTMIEQLESSKEREKRYLETLEDKIQERTKQLEDKNINLINSETRFKMLSDASFEGVLFHNEGTVIEANKALAKMLNYEKPEDFIGRHIKDIFPHEVIKEILCLGTDSFDKPFELVILQSNSMELSVEINGFSTVYHNKQCKVLTVRDITDLKRKEMEREKLLKELHKAEFTAKSEAIKVKAISQDKLASLGSLATGVAHEINQPLTYIKIIHQSCIRDIEEGKLDLTELQDDNRESLRQISRITEIVDHLRLFGREDSQTKYNINMQDVLDKTLILMGQRIKLRNIEFSSTLETSLPLVHGSLVQLEQVLINLIQNSIDALSDVDKKTIKVSMFSKNDLVIIKLYDNGHGIPEGIGDKVFEPFFTTKSVGQGTGLGLSIVFGIIKEHNGTIEHIPEKQGCTFLMSLPVAIKE